jgi:hypothetical protein
LRISARRSIASSGSQKIQRARVTPAANRIE